MFRIPIPSPTRSTRRVLATLAGSSILWRVVPDLPGAARLVDVSGEVLAPVAVIVSTLVKGSSFLAATFQWLLFFYLFYALVPRLLPDDVHPVFRRRGLRLLVAVVSVGSAAATSYTTVFLLTGNPPLLRSAYWAVGRRLSIPAFVSVPRLWWYVVLGGGWCAFALYIYWHGWRATASAERVAIFRSITHRVVDTDERAEFREALDRDGSYGTIANGIGIAAIAAITSVVCWLLGIVAGLLVLLSPIPELVVLGGVAVDAVTRRFSTGSRLALRDVGVDIEQRFYSVVAHVASSRKGYLGMIPVMIGIGISITAAFAGSATSMMLVLGPVDPLIRDVSTDPFVSLYGVWIVVGLHVSVLVAGWYGIWFWLRETYRLPHFLRHWEEAHRGSASIVETEPVPTLVARPVGNVVIPTSLLAAAIGLEQVTDTPVVGAEFSLLEGFLISGSVGYEWAELAAGFGLLGIGFAIVWPLLVLATIWTILRTRRIEPQPVRHESRAIMGAFLLQLSWGWLLVAGTRTPPITGEVLVIAVLGIYTYYVGEFFAYLELFETPWKRTGALVIPLLLLGMSLVVIGRTVPFHYYATASEITLSGVVTVGVGILGGIVSWYVTRAE